MIKQEQLVFQNKTAPAPGQHNYYVQRLLSATWLQYPWPGFFFTEHPGVLLYCPLCAHFPILFVRLKLFALKTNFPVFFFSFELFFGFSFLVGQALSSILQNSEIVILTHRTLCMTSCKVARCHTQSMCCKWPSASFTPNFSSPSVKLTDQFCVFNGQLVVATFRCQAIRSIPHCANQWRWDVCSCRYGCRFWMVTSESLFLFLPVVYL